LKQFNLDENTVCLLPAGREETNEMLRAHGYIDLIIPRGSQALIDFVRENARIPVIETGAGICHTYFDEFGDIEKGAEIVFNAKTRRPSVCNALDCLIVHEVGWLIYLHFQKGWKNKTLRFMPTKNRLAS
jgi:glutamate-5-semialdehyde dehydrogenase